MFYNNKLDIRNLKFGFVIWGKNNVFQKLLQGNYGQSSYDKLLINDVFAKIRFNTRRQPVNARKILWSR